MKSVALRYLHFGWCPIPLKAGSKSPAVAWREYQRRRPSVEEASGWSWSGVGVACGQVSGGLVVLDVDGPEGLEELRRRGHPPTPTARTNRGLHLYFKASESLPSVPDLLPGMDFKGAGGYVVAPPSAHPSGTRYEWLDGLSPEDLEPAPLPNWVHQLVRERQAGPSQSGGAKLFKEGQRNTGLTSIAGWMRRQGLSEQAIARALAEINATSCEPPLPPREVGQIAKSVARYKPGVSVSVTKETANANGNSEEGPPLVRLSERPAPGPLRWVLPPLIPAGHVAVLYGDGGTCKSFLASALALAVARRASSWLEMPLEVGGPAVYIDAELSEDAAHRRALELAAGLGLDNVPADFFLIPAVGYPEEEVFARARRAVEEHGAVLVVVDSTTFIMHGDATEAKDVLRFHREYIAPLLRAGATVLAIDHQSKGGERYGTKTEFGSVFKRNAARSSLQAEPLEQRPGLVRLVLRHQKSNFGYRGEPLGVELRFEGGRIFLSRTELEPEDMAGEVTLPLKERIVAALREESLFPDEIAERTGSTLGSVKVALSKLRRAGVVEPTGQRSPRGAEQVRLSGGVSVNYPIDNANTNTSVSSSSPPVYKSESDETSPNGEVEGRAKQVRPIVPTSQSLCRGGTQDDSEDTAETSFQEGTL